jgi:transcriptional regulator with XRE-family HTH domain
MRIREVLATNLRAARQARGVSQEDLAHAAKLDRTYISSIERERYAISIDKLDQIAQALGVEAADLLKRR